MLSMVKPPATATCSSEPWAIPGAAIACTASHATRCGSCSKAAQEQYEELRVADKKQACGSVCACHALNQLRDAATRKPLTCFHCPVSVSTRRRIGHHWMSRSRGAVCRPP